MIRKTKSRARKTSYNFIAAVCLESTAAIHPLPHQLSTLDSPQPCLTGQLGWVVCLVGVTQTLTLNVSGCLVALPLFSKFVVVTHK